MGLLKSILKGGKKVLGTAGKVAKYAAPVLAMTGVGAPLAAGIGVAGGLLDPLDDKKGYNIKDALKGAALSGGSAALLGKYGPNIPIFGGGSAPTGTNAGGGAYLPGATSPDGRVTLPPIYGAQTPGGQALLNTLAGTTTSAGGGGFWNNLGAGLGQTFGGSLGNFLTGPVGGAGGINLADILLGGAAGYGAYKASKNQGKADELVEEAIGRNRSEWEGTKPLREEGRSALLARLRANAAPSAAPDLSGLADTANPFRSKFSFALPAPGAPAAAPTSSGGASAPTQGGIAGYEMPLTRGGIPGMMDEPIPSIARKKRTNLPLTE